MIGTIVMLSYIDIRVGDATKPKGAQARTHTHTRTRARAHTHTTYVRAHARTRATHTQTRARTHTHTHMRARTHAPFRAVVDGGGAAGGPDRDQGGGAGLYNQN